MTHLITISIQTSRFNKIFFVIFAQFYGKICFIFVSICYKLVEINIQYWKFNYLFLFHLLYLICSFLFQPYIVNEQLIMTFYEYFIIVHMCFHIWIEYYREQYIRLFLNFYMRIPVLIIFNLLIFFLYIQLLHTFILLNVYTEKIKRSNDN